MTFQVRQEARELQSKYGESSPSPETEVRGPRMSKRISVPENFSYFPSVSLSSYLDTTYVTLVLVLHWSLLLVT